jgi:uncharacterized membrane protein
MVGLDSLGAPYGHSRAFGVSADGSVVVGDTLWPRPEWWWGSQAFRWSEDEGMIGLGFLPGSTMTTAVATSADGSVVVGYGTSAIFGGSARTAFRWTAAEGMVEIVEQEIDRRSSANDVSADGTVIVGTTGNEGFRWTSDGGITLLGPNSQAYAVSADGSVIVGLYGDLGAARWTANDGWTSLGIPDGTARAVSGEGSLIVTSSLIWSRELGAFDLRKLLLANGIEEVRDWSLLFAFDVSADGQTLVGRGINPLGQREAWIATIPEPSTFVLAALATAGFAAVSVRGRVAKMRRSRNRGDAALVNCP